MTAMYPIKQTPNPWITIREAHLLLQMGYGVAPTMEFIAEVRGTIAMTNREDQKFRALFRRVGVEPPATRFVDEIPEIPPNWRRSFLYTMLKQAGEAQAYHVARENGPPPRVLWPRPLLNYYPKEVKALEYV